MPLASSIEIQKESGDKQPFSVQKFQRSLKRSGLASNQLKEISSTVLPKIYSGMKTRDLYKHSLKEIKRFSPKAAINYSLKKALFSLGPQGYYFEDYIAKFMQYLGYQTKTRCIFRGKKIKHEIDVQAINYQNNILIECKFHHSQGIKNDVKLPLYIKARYQDIQQANKQEDFTQLWIFSNTSFTLDALLYSEGENITLMGTNSPKDYNFLDQIKTNGLYPVTSLYGLSKFEQQTLLKKNIILCKELLNHKKTLLKMGLSSEEINCLFQDIDYLLGDP